MFVANLANFQHLVSYPYIFPFQILMNVLQEQTAVLMLSAIIPWDHTRALAYLHIMEMDEFAKVN